ncbi:N-6 DNA methylase [Inquilinus sp. OTU3971]|uniref:N-6 DNA methylase n=1 Tax=Inquilinus sp. OTU3971 TaxID=3043855 RepID=UPI00313E7255
MNVPAVPKALGAFYTPETVADVLAEWVVQLGNERLLEPSAGEGALVRAAISHAQRCDGTGQRLRFIACDIDKDVAVRLRQSLSGEDEVWSGDFLGLSADAMPAVDGIIANPPFTRNHAIDRQRRGTLRGRFDIDGAAGLWVHFLIHACSFLRPGGRLASVIPASALFTRYGKLALSRICRQFDKVEIRRIVDRPAWVNGADERGALLFADGYGLGTSEVPEATSWSAHQLEQSRDCATGSSVFHDIVAAGSTLGSIAKIAIGAVTGCNQVFLVSEKEREAEGISIEDVVSVAARSRHVPGVLVDKDDLIHLAGVGEKTWMLVPSDIATRGTGVRRRLAQISHRKRRTTAWLQKRDPWWSVDTGPDCDAIFTYMNHLGPRLVLAGPGVKCTNTLHRVEFREGVSPGDRMAAALTLVSTFGQVAAERLGRPYGGGVLKFELVEARQFPVLRSNGEIDRRILIEADRAVRIGNIDRARNIADELLMPSILGRGWRAAVSEMNAEIVKRRRQRNKGAAV